MHLKFKLSLLVLDRTWDVTVVNPPSLQVWIIPAVVFDWSRLGQDRRQGADIRCRLRWCQAGTLNCSSIWTLDEPNGRALVLVLDWIYAGSLSRIGGILGLKC